MAQGEASVAFAQRRKPARNLSREPSNQWHRLRGLDSWTLVAILLAAFGMHTVAGDVQLQMLVYAAGTVFIVMHGHASGRSTPKASIVRLRSLMHFSTKGMSAQGHQVSLSA